MTTAAIYLGGDGPTYAPEIDDCKIVIAADSGFDLALSHETKVDVLVGDLDSIKPDSLKIAQENKIDIRSSDTEKDETDFELALNVARASHCHELCIIGGGGERIDHLLANMSVLAGVQTKQFLVDAHFRDAHIRICRAHQPRDLFAEPGTAVSLIPIGESVHGVSTQGLKWELNGSTLSTHHARGISNVCIEPEISVRVGSGNLAIIL